MTAEIASPFMEVTNMKKTLDEIQELWDNGHAEALAQYGIWCAEEAIDGYRRGSFRGLCIGIAISATVTASAICLVSTIKKKYHPGKD